MVLETGLRGRTWTEISLLFHSMMVINDSSFCDLQKMSVYLTSFYAWEKETEAVLSHQKTGLFN